MATEMENKERTDVMVFEKNNPYGTDAYTGDINFSILNKMNKIIDNFRNDATVEYVPENHVAGSSTTSWKLVNDSYDVILTMSNLDAHPERDVAGVMRGARDMTGTNDFKVEIKSHKSDKKLTFKIDKNLGAFGGEIFSFSFAESKSSFTFGWLKPSVEECLKLFDDIGLEYFHKTISNLIILAKTSQDKYEKELREKEQQEKEAKKQAKLEKQMALEAEARKKAEEAQNKLNSELDDF